MWSLLERLRWWQYESIQIDSDTVGNIIKFCCPDYLLVSAKRWQKYFYKLVLYVSFEWEWRCPSPALFDSWILLILILSETTNVTSAVGFIHTRAKAAQQPDRAVTFTSDARSASTGDRIQCNRRHHSWGCVGPVTCSRRRGFVGPLMEKDFVQQCRPSCDTMMENREQRTHQLVFMASLFCAAAHHGSGSSRYETGCIMFRLIYSRWVDSSNVCGYCCDMF